MRDSLFLGLQMVKYQTTQVSEILRKQQVHPTSIILAQAILESGWGTSRFFREGNNLFGLWSYNPGEDRMTTRDNREGKSVHLKKYSTLKECIEDYFVTIANSWAYEEFRKKRLEVENPFELIWYLQRYSELRYEYVKKVGEIMIQNDLKKYDHYVIDPIAFTEIQLK
jgi:Bax protein